MIDKQRETMPAHRIETRPATEEERKYVNAALKTHAGQVGGIHAESGTISVLALQDDELIGAVMGPVFWNWFLADLVWVAESERGHGIGKELMQTAERQARAKGLTGIYLWSGSWQAPGFYERLGYEQYATFNDFPPGHQRLGFRKYL